MPLDILPTQAADAAKATLGFFSPTPAASGDTSDEQPGWLSRMFGSLYSGDEKQPTPTAADPPTVKPTVNPTDSPTPRTIKTPIIADASGLTHTAVQNFGETRKFDGMDFDAYWAYFREDMVTEDVVVKDWMYCATNHICFKDGWSWWM